MVLLAAALRHCAVRGPRGGVLRVRGRPGCVYVYVECVNKGGGELERLYDSWQRVLAAQGEAGRLMCVQQLLW